MKFEPIKFKNGKADPEEVATRVNEIIDFLNKSYITMERDECIAVLDTDIASTDNISINDFCKPSVANIPDSLVIRDSVKIADTDTSKCPNCGASYYELGNMISTCVYYPPIIKDGVNINPDKNRHSATATCKECGHQWVINY